MYTERLSVRLTLFVVNFLRCSIEIFAAVSAIEFPKLYHRSLVLDDPILFTLLMYFR